MLEKEVETVLIGILSKYGYGKYNKQTGFKFKKNNLTYYINFVIINRRPEYYISLYLNIRSDEVEDISNKFTQNSPAYFKYSTTITIPFSYFKQQKIEFIVTDNYNIEKIGNFVAEFYPNIVEPFTEEYVNSLKQLADFVDKIVLGDDKYIPVNANVYKKDIILLKLTNNPAFETRVKEIRKIIEEYPEVDKKCFEDTYKYLKTL